jgi:hypothetical protein
MPTLSRRPPWWPPYAAMATSVFARSEARMRESSRCHLHPKIPGESFEPAPTPPNMIATGIFSALSKQI